MQKISKRRIAYLVAAVGCILLLVGGGYLVYAAMTAQDSKENDFQIGQIETKLFEENFDDDMTEAPTDQSIPKEVRIQNVGTIKQFVRVMILPEVRKNIAGDTKNEQVLPLKIGTDLLLGEMTTADWIDGGDGYYYYVKEAVEPKKHTSYLFKTVKLSSQLSDKYDQAKFSISLKVEAINCAEFAYRDAWWQGQTPATGSPLKTVDDALQKKVEK